MSELALQLIRENKQKHARGEDAGLLDLGNCGLTEGSRGDRRTGVAGNLVVFERMVGAAAKKDGKLKVECPASYADVDVLELLDGIGVDFLPGWAKGETLAQAFASQSEQPERTINIFLASSSELREDRDEFDLYFRRLNDSLRKRGVYLEIIRWEYFLDAPKPVCKTSTIRKSKAAISSSACF